GSRASPWRRSPASPISAGAAKADSWRSWTGGRRRKKHSAFSTQHSAPNSFVCPTETFETRSNGGNGDLKSQFFFGSLRFVLFLHIAKLFVVTRAAGAEC